MAHSCQEIRLCPVGLVGGFLGFLRRLPRFFRPLFGGEEVAVKPRQLGGSFGHLIREVFAVPL